MNAVGLICEYNPLHNGHIYHINKTRELFPNHVIVLALTGNFSQRGEPSVIDKIRKTKLALDYGIDLVLEIPFVYATRSAEYFADGSVSLLNAVGVKDIVFGSESGDINLLLHSAKKLLNSSVTHEELNNKESYAKVLGDKFNTPNSPNDILGIMYIKSIITNNYDITPHTIKRTNDYHSTDIESSITSASSIRNYLQKNLDVSKAVPEKTLNCLDSNLVFRDDFFNLIKYKIISDDNLDKYYLVNEGLDNKLKKEVLKSNSIEELIMNIKSKRYTYSKITRMLTHILCSLTNKEINNINGIEHIRVMGFNTLGRRYLNSIKHDLDIPLVTNSRDLKTLSGLIENRVDLIYYSKFDKSIDEYIIDYYKLLPIIKK